MPNWTSKPEHRNHTLNEQTGEYEGAEVFNPQTDEGKKTPVTYHKDGGRTYHLGGPCGDLYVDRNGET